MNKQSVDVLLWEEGETSQVFDLVREEPLSIRIEGKPYTVVMRTPGDETAHVAGFCFSEGLIDSSDDIAEISFCNESDVNVATLTLVPERRKRVPELLTRRGYISQTSCGICGKQVIADLSTAMSKVNRPGAMTPQDGLFLINQLSGVQVLRKATKASHGAAAFDAKLSVIADAEDVGRHNALDKMIGKTVLQKSTESAMVAVISSRVSYEMVQRVVRAGIPFLLSVSRPTALAVDVAQAFGVSLACLSRNDGLMIFTHKSRWNFSNRNQPGIR